MHRIEFRSVAKSFPAKRRGAATVLAVENVNLAISDGEVVSLIGPSGCGKSTLLNMGAGLYLPSRGEVFVQGKRVEAPNPEVAFMLQKDLLLPWRTIRENVEIGLEIRSIAAAERRERALALLRRCHLAGFENHYPHQLSGGMRQRAALARTFMMDSALLLMDEPFGALDAHTKLMLEQELLTLWEQNRRTVIFITHDLAEAIFLADRVLVCSARPGRIFSSIDIPFARPRNLKQLQQEDAYHKLYQRIWSELSREMDAAHV